MKKVQLALMTIVIAIIEYFVGKVLDFILKLNYSNGFFSGLIYKALSYKINVLSLLISALIVWIVYQLVVYIIRIKKKFIVIKATYGTDNIKVDFTKKLNDSIVDGGIFVYLTNSFIGSDPVHGVQKRAKVKYKLNGNVIDTEIIEGGLIQIPPV